MSTGRLYELTLSSWPDGRCEPCVRWRCLPLQRTRKIGSATARSLPTPNEDCIHFRGFFWELYAARDCFLKAGTDTDPYVQYATTLNRVPWFEQVRAYRNHLHQSTYVLEAMIQDGAMKSLQLQPLSSATETGQHGPSGEALGVLHFYLSNMHAFLKGAPAKRPSREVQRPSHVRSRPPAFGPHVHCVGVSRSGHSAATRHAWAALCSARNRRWCASRIASIAGSRASGLGGPRPPGAVSCGARRFVAFSGGHRMTVANTAQLTILFGLCAVAAALPVGAQQHSDSADSGTALALAFAQTGPVGLRGYVANAGTFLYETGKVENVSAKTISAVTFGVIVADPNNPTARTVLRSSAEVSLPPGATQNVNVRLLPGSQLEELKRSVSPTPTVTLGILAVQWADGTRWVFDLPDGARDFSLGTGRIVAADQR